jgi:lipopolysaccharide transport system permease protein
MTNPDPIPPAVAVPPQQIGERSVVGDSKAPHRSRTVIEAKARFFDIGFAEIWEYRELVYFMVWRDLKSRYKQTVLGVAWALIQPILTMLVFWVVFSLVARMPSGGIPYPLFAFIGIVPWTYFAQAVSRCSSGLVGNVNLISKVYFPRLIIPISAVITPAVDFLLSFLVMGVMLAFYGVMPTAAILALPFLFIVAVATAFGIGLWMSALHVKYRDVGHLIPFIIQIWMYASPVIYPMSIVPARYHALYSLNPMVGVIEGFRWALSGGTPPNLVAGAASLCGVAILVASGLVYFRYTEREMADVI